MPGKPTYYISFLPASESLFTAHVFIEQREPGRNLASLSRLRLRTLEDKCIREMPRT